MIQRRHVEEKEGEDTPRMRVTWEINIATILSLTALLGSAFYFVVNTHRDAQAALHDYAALSVAVEHLRGDMQTSIEKASAQLSQQITPLIDSRERLTLLERHVTEEDKWRAVVDQRLDQQRDLLSNVRSDTDAIKRASEVSLPQRHR